MFGLSKSKYKKMFLNTNKNEETKILKISILKILDAFFVSLSRINLGELRNEFLYTRDASIEVRWN